MLHLQESGYGDMGRLYFLIQSGRMRMLLYCGIGIVIIPQTVLDLQYRGREGGWWISKTGLKDFRVVSHYRIVGNIYPCSGYPPVSGSIER
jgi:hypothetical protein